MTQRVPSLYLPFSFPPWCNAIDLNNLIVHLRGKFFFYKLLSLTRIAGGLLWKYFVLIHIFTGSRAHNKKPLISEWSGLAEVGLALWSCTSCALLTGGSIGLPAASLPPFPPAGRRPIPLRVLLSVKLMFNLKQKEAPSLRWSFFLLRR